MNGAAVTVALPALDCFLNDSGTAWASGAALPVRFGTWFWGLGVTEDRWKPTKVGSNYDIGPELKPVEAYKDRISILSGFDVQADGKPALPHFTGAIVARTGTAPSAPTGLPAPSFDVLIADQIGGSNRFRSLDVTSVKDPNNSISGRGAGSLNPAEISPAAFYARLFGPEFADPNKADFKPDPMVMARRSVLSAIGEERKALEQLVGVSDREKLDQYFTAVRQAEQQVEIQLRKPDPLEACRVPGQPGPEEIGNQIEVVMANHKLMVELMAMAVACNQTRVFNVSFNQLQSALTRLGKTTAHHQLTHEEEVDPDVGYQPGSTWFVERCMEAFGQFIGVLASFKEGDGTLLDHSIVLAHSETNYAKFHTIDGLPMMIAGRGGGRIKSGLHIAGGGTPATRVGLTLQQVMGVPVDAWGTGANRTDKPVSELLA